MYNATDTIAALSTPVGESGLAVIRVSGPGAVALVLPHFRSASGQPVLELEQGVFAFKDSWGAKRLGTRRLANVLTIRKGEIAYQRPAAAAVKPAGTPVIYDILLKNGLVVDSAGRKNGRMDVGVTGGKIARVASN